MEFPANLYYTEDHEWVRANDDGTYSVGITDFAQHELDELVYVEVESVGETLEKGDIFGTVEAVKTTSDLFMPITGEVVEFNEALSESAGDDPTLVNREPYTGGWIIKVRATQPEQLADLLDAAAYQQLVAE